MRPSTPTDPHRIAAIHERLNDIGAHSAPARAAQILAGLGFDEAAQKRPCRALSGGWRMRVALAAVLFLEPEILLLDEPTNYLDLEGAMWLESYLRSYPHTVVIVSHDRDLLNRAVTAILHLDRGKLNFYSGGYDDFEEARREKQRLELKLKKHQDDERRRIQAFIDRFKAKATKAAQAQSRVKALAKMQPIAAQVDERVKPFHLPQPLKQLASPLMRFEEVAIGYAADAPVLQGLNLRIDQDDRIALLGQNGNGKSTFAKLIAGKLAPLSGQVFGARRVDVGYFAQHQLDELNPLATPYDHMLKLMPEATEAQRRTRLGTYGFSADKADTKCAKLSGGEKARLLLALAAFHAPAPADPRRADQPSRRRQPPGAGAGAGRVRRRRHPHQPRPASDRGVRRPAVGGARRHGAIVRRRHGHLSRRAAGRARRRHARAEQERRQGGRGAQRAGRPAARVGRPAGEPRAAEESDAGGGEESRNDRRRYRAARRQARRSTAIREGSVGSAERRHRARTIGEAFERGRRGLARCLRSVRSCVRRRFRRR